MKRYAKKFKNSRGKSMKTTELRVDRIEEGVAVAYDTDGAEYRMCAKIGDLAENDVLRASLNDEGEVVSAEKLPEKTEEIKAAAQSRLDRLFGRQGD